MAKKAEQRALLERLVATFETGTPGEVRDAKKALDKAFREDNQIFDKHTELVFAAFARFDALADPAHQAALVSGLSLSLLALADDYFEECQDFLLKAIQNPDGHVRDAAVKAGEWLRISLSARAHPLRLTSKPWTDDELAAQKIAIGQYTDYVRAIEVLLDYYDDGMQDEVEYIRDMKPSPRKSLEMLWDSLTHTGFQIESAQHVPAPEILAKREELETMIAELLDSTGARFCFHDVLERIYCEEGPGDFEDILAMFEDGGDAVVPASDEKFEKIAKVVNEAWNYFPHRSLGGLCPVEKIDK
jgi:hypothetical protein